MMILAALAAIVAAYVAGHLIGARTAGLETVEACRAKIDAANDKTTAAEYVAQMWRNRAIHFEERQAQLDHDVTASTTMLLDEIDQAEKRWSTFAGEAVGRAFAEDREAAR